MWWLEIQYEMVEMGTSRFMQVTGIHRFRQFQIRLGNTWVKTGVGGLKNSGDNALGEVTTWWRQRPGRWTVLKRKYVIELGSDDVTCFEVPGSYPDHEHRGCSRLPVRVDMCTYVYICIQLLHIYRTCTCYQCNSAEIVCLRTTKSTFQFHNITQNMLCIYI